MKFIGIVFKIAKGILREWQIFQSNKPVYVNTKLGIVKIERIPDNTDRPNETVVTKVTTETTETTIK